MQRIRRGGGQAHGVAACSLLRRAPWTRAHRHAKWRQFAAVRPRSSVPPSARRSHGSRTAVLAMSHDLTPPINSDRRPAARRPRTTTAPARWRPIGPSSPPSRCSSRIRSSAASRPSELAAALIGEQLGDIRLEEFVGGGGMGAVFRGVDTELHRTVAVKVLARAAVERRRVARPLRDRGPHRRPARPPEHRPRPLRRRGPRPPLHRLRVHRGHERPRPGARQRAVPAGRRPALHAANRRRAGARLAARRGPPRHQAVEHPAHARGAGEAGRHGAGPRRARRRRPNTNSPPAA